MGFLQRGLSIVLAKNWKFCERFVLCKINQEKVFGDVLVRKQAFLDNINMDLKRTQKWHFCKGDSPWFGSKIGNFVNVLFYAKYTQKKYLVTFSLEKKAFLDNINMDL